MLFTVSGPNFSDSTTYEREIVPRCPTWYIDNFMQILREKLSTGAQSDAQRQCVHEMPGGWMQTIFSRPPIESSSHVFLTNRNGKYNQHSFRIKSQHQGANIAFIQNLDMFSKKHVHVCTQWSCNFSNNSTKWSNLTNLQRFSAFTSISGHINHYVKFAKIIQINSIVWEN